MNTKQSYINGYINDLLTIIIEELNLMKKGICVIPLICIMLFRQVHQNEPILRTDIINRSKVLAEGMLSKRKTFVGWILDSTRMRIYLLTLKALR